MAADISLITSLFRSEAYLRTYAQHVLRVAARVKAAGLVLEVIPVLNDASEQERTWINELVHAAEKAQSAVIRPLYTARETPYASWNRGLQAAEGRCLGVWNVDDVREADALIEGYRLISEGCMLVDFPFIFVRQKVWGRIGLEQCISHPVQYDPTVLTRKQRLGPFFLFARDLYQHAGPFDAHFRISGDFEWGSREVVSAACFCPGTCTAGRFILHGNNLSGTSNPLEDVEDNVVFLRRGAYEELRPVDPELMRNCWEGGQNAQLPTEIEEHLWGPQAGENWQRWLAARRKLRRSERWRTLPRRVIDWTHLRHLLARLGIVQPQAFDRPSIKTRLTWQR